ncbi:MAG: flagellar biogenesis protein FliO [Halioglobus sp.]|jgi:flagellar biogenesis protein FliO
MKRNTIRTFFSSLLLLIFLLTSPSWADAPDLAEETPVLQSKRAPYYPDVGNYLKSPPVESEIPPKVSFGAQMIQMLLMLGLILLLLLFSAWFIRRMMQTRTHSLNKVNDIKILEQRALSQKAIVYLLEISGKKIVLGESPAGLHYFTEFAEERNALASDTNLQHSFEEVMQRKIQKERV